MGKVFGHCHFHESIIIFGYVVKIRELPFAYLISHMVVNEIYFIEMIASPFSFSCHLFWCLVARAYAFPKACLLGMYS